MWRVITSVFLLLVVAGCGYQRIQAVVVKTPPRQVQIEKTPSPPAGLPACWEDPGCQIICNRGHRDVKFRINNQPELFTLQNHTCMPKESDFRFALGRHVIRSTATIRIANEAVEVVREIHIEISRFTRPQSEIDVGFYR